MSTLRDTVFDNLSDICNDDEHIKNLKIIKNILNKQSGIDVWVAFGDYIFERNYLCSCWKEIYTEIKSEKVKWFSTGKNISGSPKHPLYQKDTSKLINFDMESFISNKNFNKHL